MSLFLIVLGPPSLTLFSPPTQGFVLDIYYQGSEADIQRCARPDGRVPLVWLPPRLGGFGDPVEKGGFAFLLGKELSSF